MKELYKRGMYKVINKDERLIFHIDVNSAFLSWSAVYYKQKGSLIDLRDIPSIVGGDPITRHGIVLARSAPAKSLGIKTAESIYSAREKCPELVIIKPAYELYVNCSNALIKILSQYTPQIQRFSIDECFLDFTGMTHLYEDYMGLAYNIKERIKKELGFTVNIGISTNKLLAKMGGELKKPDMIHTLFPDEIKTKMWPLPVEELMMVGRATAPKLNQLNIFTIGDLANYNINILRYKLKSYGMLIWKYANGIDDSEVRKSNHIVMKGIGNSTTISFDVADKETAHQVILSLSEKVGMRLRESENYCRLIEICVRNANFINYSHQRKIYTSTDCTKKISQVACQLFDEIWQGEPIRHLAVRVSDLCTNEYCQSTLWDDKNIEKERAVDKVIDSLRQKFGDKSIVRATFLHSPIKGVSGGVGEEDYPSMSSIL